MLIVSIAGHTRLLCAVTVLGLLTGLSVPALANVACHDVPKQQPRSLTGILDYHMFTYPPN
jgi:hypothetical protein